MLEVLQREVIEVLLVVETVLPKDMASLPTSSAKSILNLVIQQMFATFEPIY